MKRRTEKKRSNAEIREHDRVKYAYIEKDVKRNIRIPTDEEKNILCKGMFVHVTEDSKTRMAKEIGKRKPYQDCYGGLHMRQEGKA